MRKLYNTKKLLGNIKIMVKTPGAWILVAGTILFFSFLFGWTIGSIMGPLMSYGLLFQDDDYRWDGNNWVNKDGVPHKR